jgi:hypothetical protein
MARIAGRTSLHGQFLELKGKLYRIGPLSNEPTAPGYGGYRVQVARFVREELRDRMDFARAIVYPGCTTPPQLVVREGRISDFPVSGTGWFVICRPDKGLEVCKYDENDPRQYNLEIRYGAGCYQFWEAHTTLTLFEICYDPIYQPGDLKNLNMETDEMPDEFRKAFLHLSGQFWRANFSGKKSTN